MLRRRAESEEAQLPDLHARPELDRQGGHVGQLQRDVAGEAGVDEPRSRMGQQPEPPERRLALEPGRDVVRQRHDFVRRREDELPWMQDERLVGIRLDEAGQLRLLDRRVDVGVTMVLEDAEVAIEPDVDRGRLDHRFVVGLEHHATLVELGSDVAVGQQHGPNLMRRRHGPVGRRALPLASEHDGPVRRHRRSRRRRHRNGS